MHNSLHNHQVILYQTDEEFGDAIQEHAKHAFERGETLITIATPDHLRIVNERLKVLGVLTGLLVQLDANETLEQFYIAGALDEKLFRHIIGGVLQRAEDATQGRLVWAYGEMVDVLVNRGRPDDAIQLEELWNKLSEEKSFSLLCGYRMDPLNPTVNLSFVTSVCQAHKRVLPTSDESALIAALTQALELSLGPEGAKDAWQKVSARSGSMPRSLAMTLWLRLNHPKVADAVSTHICFENRPA